MLLLANEREVWRAKPSRNPVFPVLVVGNADHEHRKHDVLRGPAAPQPPLARMPQYPLQEVSGMMQQIAVRRYDARAGTNVTVDNKEPPMVELAPNNAYGLALATPVMTAAGCFGYGVEYARLIEESRIGAIVTRAISLHGRRANTPLRFIETPAGLLRSGDAPELRIGAALAEYAPVWARWRTPVLLSVANDHAAVAAALEGVEGVAGIELPCPADASQAAAIVAAVRAVTLLPLLAKFAPHEAIAATARATVDAGADALVLCGSPRALHIDAQSGERFEGWLSGPALRPLALRIVAEVAAAVDAPIVACGGIASAADARQFLYAGARAVQVGSALLADPGAAARIAEELAAQARGSVV
jgi:dihydroorotate dehydrogenase (NAD+) catalytic subunit